MYFNDRWFNTLKAKSGITWSRAIQDTPLSDDVRALTSIVSSKEYNSTVWSYILPLTNYYGSFDTWTGWSPDTTLVWSTLKSSWSRHLYPSHYDFGTYEDNDWVIHYIMTSATSNQVFEMETWFDDLWSPIECELRTKKFDLWDSMQWSTHTAVDLKWLKSEWGEMIVDVLVDGQSVWWATITDDFADITSSVLTIWSRVIWELVIWGWETSNNLIDLFNYFIRIPMYEAWGDIQINISSSTTWLVWTLDNITLHVEKESTTLFEYNNIW